MANRPYFIQYDIPELRGRPVCANPSDELWGARCVRITYSCWLAMESNLHRVYPLLNRLSEYGVRWYAIPFDVSASADLRNMALENIRREIAERLVAARQTRDEAETRLDDESDTQFTRRRSRYLAAARSIERRVTEMVARVAPAAAVFGITEADLRTVEAVGEVELIASNMRARAAAFATMHGILTRSRHDGARVMARSLRAGEIHPVIAADFLSDIGEDGAADEVRGAFDFFC